MSALFSDPAILGWFFVVVLGVAGEFGGFRGSALFIGLPALATAICAACFTALSAPEQIAVFAVLFASHAAIIRYLSDHEDPSDNVDPKAGPL